MTLLLICYMCGQSEKVRLSMRLLIISAATCILAFWASSSYAYDIWIQPGENGLYPTTYETSATVVSSSVLMHDNDTAASNKKEDSIDSLLDELLNDQSLQQSPIELELQNLVTLADAFPYSDVYAWNNIAFYQVVLTYLSEKDPSSHKAYIESIIDLLYYLPTSTLEPYNLEIWGIITWFDAILMTAETYPAINQQRQYSWNGLWEYYTIDVYNNWYSRFTMQEWYWVKRVSFYVNWMFARGCEWTQCNSVLLSATHWDVVEAHTTIRSKEYTKLTTQL